MIYYCVTNTHKNWWLKTKPFIRALSCTLNQVHLGGCFAPYDVGRLKAQWGLKIKDGRTHMSGASAGMARTAGGWPGISRPRFPIAVARSLSMVAQSSKTEI